MFIQITAGVFGHVVNGTVKAVKAFDPPIEVEGKVGERLVKRGVAVELTNDIPKGTEVKGGYNIDTGEFEDDTEPTQTEQPAENPEDDAEQAQNEEDDVPAEFPEYSADMTRTQLEEIGRELGLDESELKAAKNKAAVIAMLDEAKAEFEAEDAPNFDPEAAIQ